MMGTRDKMGLHPRTEVDLRRYSSVLWKWLWLLALSTVLAAGASYYASLSIPPIYRTSTTLMAGEESSSPNVSQDQLAVSQRLAAAYAGMATRQPVLQATVESLGLPIPWWELQGRVLANQVAGTQLIEIRVTDNDPHRAKAIIDEITRQIVLLSPTAEYVQQMEDRRRFVRQQLDSLEKLIAQAEASITEKQAAMRQETSARGVLELQDEIRALMLNLDGWRSTYATLLTSYRARASNTLSVVEPSFVPTQPISPDIRANVLMAAAMGLLLAVAAAFAIEYLSDTLASAQDVARALSLPTLGSIADMGKAQSKRDLLVVARDPGAPMSEAYRVLRSNVLFACADEGHLMLLVSSAGGQEGKSVTSANLAASLAQAGKRTILVDADLRHPSLHGIFGCSNRVGLTSLVLDLEAEHRHPNRQEPGVASRPRASRNAAELKRRLESTLVATGIPNLSLLPTGPVPANPAELLGFSRTEQLMRLLRSAADVVIEDSPPVLPVADATILAAMDVGVLVVVEAGKTRRTAAIQAKENLLRANARILGVVLNRVPRTSLSHYYRYYGQAVPGRRAESGASLPRETAPIVPPGQQPASGAPPEQVKTSTDGRGSSADAVAVLREQTHGESHDR